MSRSFPSRRDVLRGGALALGAASLAPSTGALPSARPRWKIDNVLRVGAIGVGRRATGGLLPRLGYVRRDMATGELKPQTPRMPDVELVAICDVFQDNLDEMGAAVERAGGKATLYKRYREMLDREDLDAVIVATPDFTHAPIAQAAVEAGCDVYLEKCAANTPQQLRDLEAAVAEHGRIVQVGYQLRQDEIHRQAKEVVKRGWIGETRLITHAVHRSGSTGSLRHPLLQYGEAPDPGRVDWDLFLDGRAPERPYEAGRFFEWRKYWDYCNGIFGDNQSHIVDAAEFIADLGLPATAVASGGVYGSDEGRETPDVITAVLEYPDQGLSLRFTEIDCNSHPSQVSSYHGTEGTLEISWELKVFPDRFSSKYADALEAGKLNPNKPVIHLKDRAAATALSANPSEMWLAGRGATKTTRGGGEFDTTLLHLQDFFDSVRSREKPIADLSSSRVSTIAAQMSAEALRSGTRITPQDLGFEPAPSNAATERPGSHSESE